MDSIRDKFSADRPIDEPEHDKLGFDAPSKLMAEAILKFASPEGFVIGLEGAWGTGKSSFINLVSKHLESKSNRPEIVQFSPWLISSRDGLLSELFQEIGGAADAILDGVKAKEVVAKRKWIFKKKNVADKSELKIALNKYSNHLITAGKIAKIGGNLGVPYVGLAESALTQAGQTGKHLSQAVPLDKQKEKIKKELRKLPQQIVIFIDDLDRLEPREAGEVVRLVRAVADFPNIVYVLSYSREILTHSLAQAFKLKESDNYIDKIVQVTFSVPKPEDFALRRMFRKSLADIFPTLNGVPSVSDYNSATQRIASVIDSQGGKTLSAPRDVARTLNALRLYAGSVFDNIDLADMVWLQLIRIRNDQLYKWVETYMNNVGAIVNEKGQINETAKKETCRELTELIKKEEGHDDVDDVIYGIGAILPGIKKTRQGEGNQQTFDWAVYQDISEASTADFIKQRRIGSPLHYRYYFALSKPSNALADEEFKRFLDILETNETKAVEAFINLCNHKTDSGSVIAESYVTRFDAIDFDDLSQNQIKAMILCLVGGMDMAATITGRGDWGHYWILDIADKLYKKLLVSLDASNRKDIIENVYSLGIGIGWLSSLIRRETFAHGLYGDNVKPPSMWIFTEDELTEILFRYTETIKAQTPDDLVKLPNFSNSLYAWLQSEANQDKTSAEIGEWLSEYIQTDTGLLSFLNGIRGWSHSGKVYHPLREETVETFLDLEEVKNRVTNIAMDKNHKLNAFGLEIQEALHQARN